MPTRTLSGWSAMKALAAFCAATRRFGSTSLARMLPETSIARITVSCEDGSVITALGRAIAMMSSTSAVAIRNGGTCRRQLAPRMASLTSARFE